VIMITRTCLRHRRLVVLAWLVLTAVGAVTASSTASRLTNSFATLGTAGYGANLHSYPTPRMPKPRNRVHSLVSRT
jgi:uncharacterized membrane protein YdfJ with MMPL/SSD domain